MSLGETNTDLGHQGAEREKDSNLLTVIMILSKGHRAPRVRRKKQGKSQGLIRKIESC